MANLTPTPGWDDVFQLERSTAALGGAGGPMNLQAQALLNRTEFLRLYKYADDAETRLLADVIAETGAHLKDFGDVGVSSSADTALANAALERDDVQALVITQDAIIDLSTLVVPENKIVIDHSRGQIIQRKIQPARRSTTFSWGMNVVSSSANGMASDQMKVNLKTMAELGADAAVLVPVWYQDTLTSLSIASAANSPSDSAIRAAAEYAKSVGLRVVIKPHVNVATGESRDNINPSNHATWMTSYTSFILHYAELAADVGADLFFVGVELEDANIGHSAAWRTLVASVRDVFSGSLSYASNRLGEAMVMDWWDVVDYIGIDFYDALTAVGVESPTEQTLIDAWYSQGYVANLSRLSRKWGLPIIGAELGYYSRTDTAGNPGTISSATVSAEAQATAYRAAFKVLSAHEAVAGLYLWALDASGTVSAGGYAFIPSITDVMDEMKRFWLSGASNEKPTRGVGAGTRVTQSTELAIPTGTNTILGFNSPAGTYWDGVQTNTDKMWDVDLHRSRITAVNAGVYMVGANIAWESNATGIRRVRLLLNGTDAIAIDTRSPVSGQSTNQSVSTCLYLNRGDYVVCEVYQSSGGDLKIPKFSNNSTPAFWATMIR